ncbi:hypothetical protein GW17_00054664, partial [Ensete ventricosum]
MYSLVSRFVSSRNDQEAASREEESLLGDSPLSTRLVAWPLGTGAVRQPPQPRRDGASSLLLCAHLRRAGAVSWRRPRRIDSLHARQ